MKVSYKREMNHNYLMIEQEQQESSYEARMLVNNAIEGLLKFRIKKVDHHCYFCYEITSRQPLSRLLESKSLGAEELRRLIITMARTLNRMEEYLLSEEQVLVQPEYIYVEPELFQVEFCLIPGRCGDFPQEVCRLLEYLLGKVDYQDKDCVVLAYGLYRESLKENYGMEDLLRFLGGGAVQEPGGKRLREPDGKEYGESGGREPGGLGGKRLGGQESGESGGERLEEGNGVAEGKVESEKAQKHSWVQRIRRWIASWFEGGESQKDEVQPWQMVFPDEEDSAEAEPVQVDLADPSGQTGKDAWKTEGEMKEENLGTVLLTERKEQPPVRRLMSMEPDEPDICIAYYPFLIGKQESLVDYVLNKDTVSRLHLRLDEEEGSYWATDLNSTNGTMVAGQLLDNNQKVPIEIGDEVIIAGIRFHFA